MRENLFRGKDIDGKWVEGCCVVDEMDTNKVYIGYIFGSDGRQPHNTDVALVDPETVCQYTGLTDKNGRKIFEGDIVKIGLEHYEVWWNCDSSSITLSSKNESRGLYLSHNETVEVIGNIFDNPELIGEHP